MSSGARHELEQLRGHVELMLGLAGPLERAAAAPIVHNLLSLLERLVAEIEQRQKRTPAG